MWLAKNGVSVGRRIGRPLDGFADDDAFDDADAFDDVDAFAVFSEDGALDDDSFDAFAADDAFAARAGFFGSLLFVTRSSSRWSAARLRYAVVW